MATAARLRPTFCAISSCRIPNSPAKPRVTLRFFDRIEIGALQIFDQREFQHIAIVRRSNNDRHLRQSCFQRCSPAPFTGDQFVTPIDLAHNQRLNDSVLPDGFDQLRERIRAEFLARLQWTWRDAVETDLPNFFGMIIGQGSNSRRRCRLSGNERAETFAKRHFCHRAEIIGTQLRNANSSLRHFAARIASFMAATVTETFTLGHSPDPDDAFMFYAMAANKIDLRGYRFKHQLEDIQTLNERAMRGELHISAVSIHAYAYVSDKYLLLPCGASMGDGYGPLVIEKHRTPNAEHRTSNEEDARAITQLSDRGARHDDERVSGSETLSR